MNVDRLIAMRQFVTVVDCGSFSAAARLLNLGQPAVSKAMAALEDYLGVQLLVRTTRSHALTEAGQRFYDRARIALDEADAAMAAAREEGMSLTGRLRVSAPPSYASLHIIPRLEGFLAEHPGLSLDLVLDDRRVDLVEEGVDLAIRSGTLGDSSLVARRIDSTPRMIAGAASYLDRHGAPDSPAALSGHRLITFTGFTGPATWTFSQGSSSVSAVVEGTIRVSAAEGLRAALFAGLGLAMVTRRMVEAELASGAIRPVLTDWSLPPSDIWALFPSGRRTSRRARLFADWLAGMFDTA